MNRIIKRIIMATASLNIRLSYNQILELARQLSDEDKLQSNRELSAEVRKIELQRLLTNENNWYSICTGLILTILSALFANKILDKLWMHLVLYLQSE